MTTGERARTGDEKVPQASARRTTTAEKQRAAQVLATARPRGEQAISAALYARIRTAVRQLSGS